MDPERRIHQQVHRLITGGGGDRLLRELFGEHRGGRLGDGDVVGEPAQQRLHAGRYGENLLDAAQLPVVHGQTTQPPDEGRGDHRVGP